MPMQIFEAIEWTRPWLAALRPQAEFIISASDWRIALNTAANERGLQNHRGLPIRFVPQNTLPSGVAYESFISSTGQVPTRENLHDFFNALIWLTFPSIKRQLNALQAEALALLPDGVNHDQTKPLPSHRGKLRDAATIFDENAAILVVRCEKFLNNFRQHHWNKIFIECRSNFFEQCELRLFGHALIEKLVNPYKAITAHAWPVIMSEQFFAMTEQEKQRLIDHTVARQLESGLAMTSFSPLPILGIPGWWANQNPEFYSDVSVFRPAKASTPVHRS